MANTVTVEIIEENNQILLTEETVELILGESGPQGPRGNTILNGSGEPNLLLGEIGDFYLNNDNKDFYGPKDSDGWGTPISLLSGAVTISDLGYIHNQNVAALEWTINHGLGFIPNITVVDSGGSVVEGSYTYPNSNTVILNFSVEFSGKAYLS